MQSKAPVNPDVACLAGSLDDTELSVFLQMKAMFPMIDDIEVLKTMRKCKGRHNNVVDILVRMSQRIEKKNEAAKRQCEKMVCFCHSFQTDSVETL